MKLMTVLAGTLAAALAAESSGAGPAPEIDLLWAVKIPMRDGVRLNATVFKPKAQQDRLPVIFTLTPYNSDTYYARARYFAHPRVDELWKSLRPSAADYARIQVPVLTITGHYDDDQYGAMHYYRRHMEHGTAEAKQRHFLVVGPWDHAGTRTPNREVGGLTFGPASLLDLNVLHKAWYDWTMKGGPKPEFLKDRIAYYVVPSDEWKYAGALEEVAKETRTLYLGSDGSAADVFHSGSLSPVKPGTSSPDRYTYDPRDTRPAALETEEVKSYLTDQRYVLSTFGNGVVYTSEPFAEPAELAGYVRFSAWIALDVPDTAKDARTAHVAVHHDAKYPSALTIPIVN